MAHFIFAIAINMGIGGWIAAIISALGFVIMFGIASSMGDYQGLIQTTLNNDAIQRDRKKAKNS